MPRRPQLFDLIRSLTPSEKRYFKLQASIAGSSHNYVRLFDAVDAQSRYDEDALRARFRGAAFVRQLHVTKNYLTRLILRSLRSYHASSTQDATLKELLRDAEVLFRKELFDHCEVVVRKAEAIAERYEKQGALLEALGWRRRLLLARHGALERREEIKALLQRERACIGRLATLNGYWSLTMDSVEMSARRPDELRRHPLITQVSSADTLQARTLRWHILYVHAAVTGDETGAEQHITRLIELLERHPEQIREDPTSYITALNNKVGVLLQRRRLHAVPELLERIRSVPERYQGGRHTAVSIRVILRTYNVELEMYRDSGAAEKGIALVATVDRFLSTHGSAVPREYALLFYYQFAYLHFMHGDFSKALFWLNRIIGGSFDSLREDIQSFARLLHLVIHFELRNFGVLKYAVDSCRRFLRKKRELHDFERILLRFFSKASMSPTRSHPELLRQLHADLFPPSTPKMDRDALDYFDVRGWIESKGALR
ncbi:MAG TPA: hypothetical protein VJ596_05605 [Gemmatimonadaceae bacterium]|nr:hypothetical protein [Gemmatimonadaceae bacterium]